MEQQPPSTSSQSEEAPAVVHKVYIRGPTIGDAVTAQDLRTSFEKFGELLDVWCATHGRNFAFVQFARKEDAEASIAALNDTEINGCRLQVELARNAPQRGGRGNGDNVPRDRNGFETKAGDWTCPKCNVNNFARRLQCFRCQAEKPEGGGGGGSSRRYEDRGSGRRGGYDDDRRGGGGGGYDDDRRSRRRSRDRYDSYERRGGGGSYEDRAPRSYEDRAPTRGRGGRSPRG